MTYGKYENGKREKHKLWNIHFLHHKSGIVESLETTDSQHY